MPSRTAIGWPNVNKPCITNSRPVRYRFLHVHGLLAVGQFAVGQFAVKKMLVSVILG